MLEYPCDGMFDWIMFYINDIVLSIDKILF